jgi:hypothetical protein
MLFTPGWCIVWPDERIARVLAVDTENELIWMIDCEAKDALPVAYFADDDELVHTRHLERDPYERLRVSDECFSKKCCEHRDKRLQLLSHLLWNEDGQLRTDIFDPGVRGRAIRELAQQTGHAKDTLLGYVRSFWQRGMIPNALLPDLHRSGGKGQHKSHKQKPGRPSRLEKAQGSQGTGFIVNDAAREKMQRGYERHYVKNSHSTLPDAYEWMLRDEFADYEITDEGQRRPVLYPEEQRPTYRQFEYWCHEQRNMAHTSEGRKGKRRHQREHGAKSGNFTEAALGPGSIVQTDWTYGHYLVSSYDHATPIGRAIIIFYICTFSRLVVGFHIGLREDWESVILGFENMATPAREVFGRIGVPFDDNGESYACIPDVLLIDGGKVDVRNASGIVRLGTTVDTAPRYMPQIKAIVEKLNHLIKAKVDRYLGSPKRSAFDDPNPRFAARVDLATYKGIIGEVVIVQNTSIIEEYPLDKEMDEAGIVPVPTELWKFGKAYRCLPRTLDLPLVRLNLLPQATARVTQRAIEFRGLDYTCEQAGEWHAQAGLRKRKSYTMTVSYHPGLVDYIYVYDKGQLITTCYLAGPHQKFQGLCWKEVEEAIEAAKLRIDEYEQATLQQRIDRSAAIEEQVRQAEAEVAENRRGMSKRAIQEGGGEKREQESRHQSKQQAWGPEEVGAVSASSESQSHDAEDPETLTNQDTDIPRQYTEQQGQEPSEDHGTDGSEPTPGPPSDRPTSASKKHDILRKIQERKLNNEEE